MFLKNKYHTWYFQIIDNARLQNRIKHKRTNVNYEYFECHHIIPRSLGGVDSLDNLVLLTAREHFICHKLLVKITAGSDYYKMCNALTAMKRISENQGRIINSYDFEFIRKHVAAKNSKLFKGRKQSDEHIAKRTEKLKGYKHSKEFVKKRREINQQMWQNGVFDNRPKHTEETKQKISESLRGNVVSNQTKQKISKALTGQNRSDETKSKISASRKKNPRTWIKRLDERIYANILISELEYWIDKGWVKGKYQKDAKCVIVKKKGAD